MAGFPDTLFYLCVTILLGGCIYNIISYVALRKWLRGWNNVSPNTKHKLALTVLVSVRDEESSAADSIRFFAQWLQNNDRLDRVRVVFVSAMDRDAKQATATKAVVAATLREILHTQPHLAKELLHLHCPNSVTSKANQINWAVSQLFHDAPGGGPISLLGFYDVDARPSSRVFAALVDSVDSKGCFPECLQQLTIYYSADGRRPRVTIWGQLAAMWQTRFSLLVEAFALDLQRFKRLRLLRWTVGNGLFLQLDLFRKMHGFSERHEVEDIELGFRLSLADVQIQRVPVFLESGNPDNILDDIIQKQRWFRGVWHYLAYARDARHTAQAKVANGLAAQGLIRAAGWLLFGPLIFFVSVYGVVISERPIDAILAFSGIGYAMLAAFLSETVVTELRDTPITKTQISSLTHRVLRVGFAPLYAFAFALGPLVHVIGVLPGVAIRKIVNGWNRYARQ